MIVVFKKWECMAVGSYYSTPENRKAIILTDIDEGAMVATSTTNLPEIPCGPNEVFIKDYSENEGMVNALMEADVISGNPISIVQSGFVEISKYKLTETALEKLFK